MSKDPIKALKQLTEQQVAMTNKLSHMETRLQDINDEFSDLLFVIADLVADHYAGMPTPGTVERAESLLQKMREKYG